MGRELEILEVPGAPASAPAAEQGELLKFVDVSKEFDVTGGGILQRKLGTLHAVSDVSLSIRRGETFGLVGESGCGKTTLGRMGVALEPPTRGKIVFNGTDLAAVGRGELRELRRNIQFMFQDPYASLDPRMRVREIIGEPLAVAKRGTADERYERVKELVKEVGLPADAIGRYPHEFSGGQRQRLGLARALALNPDVIIADEPVSALDVSVRSQVLNLMKRLQASHGLTYVVISHDLSVVRYMADRIGVMYLGKVVETGTSDDIYQRPAHPYTQGLLEAIPLPDPDTRRSTSEQAPISGELPSPLNPPSGCRFRTRCPRAQDICAEQEPPLRPFSDSHQAACHFPLQTPLETALANGSGQAPAEELVGQDGEGHQGDAGHGNGAA
ncbi:MAG: ATP-binding cassette domain-containing protein [Solirubrobacterales bacterium]|nr:ATP-binding cassette domain-containing protein [Solirubrobacterales bacterium]